MRLKFASTNRSAPSHPGRQPSSTKGIWCWEAAGSREAMAGGHRSAYRCLHAAMDSLPVANRLGYLYARVLDVSLPRLRRTAYANLGFALPNADRDKVTDGVFRTIGRVLVALARFPLINKENVHGWIRYEGL